jgi:hypothetical protein
MKRQRRQEERPALEIVEEAFHLVRHGSTAALTAYYLGSLPFVLAALFFWSDMAHSAFASERLTLGSLGLTFLFLWMKTWQGVAAQLWMAGVNGKPGPAWKPRWLLRIAFHQAAVQPFGLFLLPVCLALLAPFGWVYAFFANATVFSGTASPDLRALLQRCWRQAMLWPLQNHYALSLFQLFGVFVLLNLLTGVLAVPFLMKSLLGIETVFTQSPWAALNSTLLAALAGLTYLCVDPLIKAAYVLRCFYGESLQTGADLRAELKRFAAPGKLATATSLLIVGQLILAPFTFAQETGAPQNTPSSSPITRNPQPESRSSISPSALDRSIEQVIQKREYSWRLPREQQRAKTPDADLNWLQRFFKSMEDGIKAMGRWIGDAIEWIFQQFRPKTGPNLGSFNLAASMRSLLFVVIVVLAALLLWLLFRVWSRRDPKVEVEADAISAVPDLTDESVGAEQLPEDSWMKLARDLLGRGELRLALRALYLASLAHLAKENVITLAKFKSNRDYEREVRRRGHTLAELPGLFAQNVSDFERVWYGLHQVTQDMVSDFARNVERMRSPA